MVDTAPPWHQFRGRGRRVCIVVGGLPAAVARMQPGARVASMLPLYNCCSGAIGIMLFVILVNGENAHALSTPGIKLSQINVMFTLQLQFGDLNLAAAVFAFQVLF